MRGPLGADRRTVGSGGADEYHIELIAPNRQRRSQTQDGRKLRRYRRQWKVERLFAWMHHFRRLVTRWEYHIENFLGFVQLACLHILLRHFMKLLPGPLRRMRSQSTYSEIIPIVPSHVSTN